LTQGDRLAARARAAGVALLALAAAGVTWRLRPSTGLTTGSPDAAVVLGCAWLAWLLASYLALAVAASAIAHLVAGRATAARILARLAPGSVRRLVDAAVTLGAATAVLTGTTAAASAAPVNHVVASRTVDRAIPGSGLDWPGLRSPARPVPHPHPHRRQPAAFVDVQPGDTLWSIAARQLGPGATGGEITAAWHAWYAANRSVIGANPNLIQPGQQLVAPQRGSNR
jgi:nucleoid-associated protein YgaU